jgi:four helix bundle protein
LAELETHFLIAARLSYLKLGDLESVMALIDEVGRMLAGLTRKLKEVST